MPRHPGSGVRTAWIAALVALLLVVVALSLAIGSNLLPLSTVWEALVAREETPDHAVIWDGRVPRTLLGLVVGAALGAAGALTQGLTRNPLADPGVLGVNAGAAFFVVVAVGFLGVGSVIGYVWFALAGAFLVSVAVYVIGSGRQGADPVRLALAGVALGAVLTGISEGLALLRPRAFDRLRAWSIGSLDVQDLEPTLVILPFVLAGLLCAAFAARGLNALAMGEDLAQTLGARVVLTRGLAVAAITLLAGSATAAAGVLLFLGLMVPHVARRICGPDNRWILGLSMLLGSVLLLASDVVGRLILPGKLEAGVVVTFVGAPFLIAIARRRRVTAL